MLASIRRFTKTWPARALFVLLVLAFGFWGVGDVVRNLGSDTAVARVDGTRIEPAQAQRAYTAQMSQITKSYGANFTPPPEMRRQVAAQTVQQLVSQTALSNELKRLGVGASDAAIRDAAFVIPAFAGPNGKFDRATFLSVLQRNNLDEPQFIELVRADVTQRQLIDAIGAGVKAPAALVGQLYAYAHETRVAVAVNFPVASASAVPTATEAQLRRFWANHPEIYATPEYRRIAAVILSPQTLAADMKVSADEIKNYYTARNEAFNKPERRSVQIVSTPDQPGAARLAAAWQAGADWPGIQAQAKAVGASAVELPAAKRAELPDAALGLAAFAAPAGLVSQPVHGDFGWYVLKVTAITPAVATDLAAASADIRTQIALLKANDALDDKANKLEDALAGGGALDQLPQGLGVAAVTGTLDAQGNTPDGTPAPLPAFADLRAAIIAEAFKMKPGDTAHLDQVPATKENPAGAYYAVTVENVSKPAQLGYDQVQARVRADWSRDQARRIAEAAAAKLLTAVNGGASLTQAATSAGLQAVTLPPVPRPLGQNTTPAGVPETLVQPLFSMKTGAATMVSTPDGFMVAQLQSIDVPPTSADPIGADQLGTSLAKSVSTDVDNLYAEALRRRSKVVFNDKLISQLAQP